MILHMLEFSMTCLKFKLNTIFLVLNILYNKFEIQYVYLVLIRFNIINGIETFTTNGIIKFAYFQTAHNQIAYTNCY